MRLDDQEPAPRGRRIVAVMNTVTAGTLFVAGAAIVARAWWITERGLDITDEGMALNWTAHPRDWPGSTSLFAFVLQPLWLLSGQDVVITRRLMIGLLLMASAIFFIVVLRYAVGASARMATASGALMAPVGLFAFGSPLVIAFPHYNILGIVGVLLAGAAFVAIAIPDRRPAGAWVLLGVAGVICLASRPTSAALLLLLVLAGLAAAGRWSMRGLLTAAATSLAGILALGIVADGNPILLAGRIQEGLTLYRIQTQRSTWDTISNTWNNSASWTAQDVVVGIVMGGLLVLLFAGISAVARRSEAGGAVIGMIAVLLVVATGVFLLITLKQVLTQYPARLVTVGGALLIGGLIAGVLVRHRADRRHMAVGMVLLLLPAVFAFGTYNSMITLTGAASACWLGASVAMVCGFKRPLTLVFVLGAVWMLAASANIATSVAWPSRQSPLVQATRSVSLGGHGSILIAPELAEFLVDVHHRAESAGFSAGDPVLDLTGESPGLVFALGGRATADSWVIGGYQGSADRLRRELTEQVSCQQIARSWLLVAPEGKRSIDPSVLESVERAFPRDYELVGSATAPAVSSTAGTVELWKPSGSPATCGGTPS